MGYGVKLQQASLQSASAWSDESLVAAGGAGTYVKVAAVYVMSKVAGEVTFETGGDTVVWEVYPAANGGMQQTAPEGQFLFVCDANEALTVTSDITGEQFVSVLYVVEAKA